MSAEPSRFQHISPVAQRILHAGESGLFEFKREIDAVTPNLLAAIANTVALTEDTVDAQLLVGVEEVEDPSTGVVIGQPCGLPRGVDKAVARVLDVTSKTRPIPVDVFVVEEGVATDHPFLRLVVRPTQPPHYDDQGRRQVRQGRSTRALTDDEMLRVYLDREAGTFAVRFQQTTTLLQSAVGVLQGQVDAIGTQIDKSIAQPIIALVDSTESAAAAASRAASSADDATSAADNAGYEVEQVQQLVRDLSDVVARIENDTAPSLASRVARRRRKVWWAFSLDTFESSSSRAVQLAKRLELLLRRDIDLDPAANSWELALWGDVLDRRAARHRQTGSQRWWTAEIAEAAEYIVTPAYAPPDLPDLRSALHADLDHEADDPASITRRFESLMDEE
ncbi:AlbA family DNA-binding domain-containing protein [Klenkia taihuensis]|uniref:DNA-binding domain-containing protein n=1 Tax=Klenkia taihuensis TaxID=1225127 RepID=A0A1I1U694_9ACTN|nr:hypothetical protein [Klenkia taihuensis]GHE07017.1 hypothetical protein GCM10011381_01420 [Klenkia taihuensis]SFD64243.1 hypothetical protein SAMN05661030_3860 [Klenkia taihuensis]